MAHRFVRESVRGPGTDDGGGFRVRAETAALLVVSVLAGCAPDGGDGRQAPSGPIVATTLAEVPGEAVVESIRMARPARSPESIGRMTLHDPPPVEAPATPREAPIQGRLVLSLRTEADRIVTAPKVELLGAAWGHTKRLDLASTGDPLVISLARLHSLLGEHFVSARQETRVQLLIQAEGAASMQSEPLLWDGKERYQPLARGIAITFPRHPTIVIDDDKDHAARLVLRPRKTRMIRFVDGDGSAVAGVGVTSYLHWSSENHCGSLSGVERLGRGVSDREGRVEIPDGDFEYALVLDGGAYRFPRWRVEPWRWVGHLSGEESVLVLHRIRARPLEIVVRKDGRPLAGWPVCSRLIYGCGVNFGRFATTDEEGRIHVPEHQDELYESVYIEDKDGNLVWSMDPRARPDGQVISASVSDD